jgi:hypothetical protein
VSLFFATHNTKERCYERGLWDTPTIASNAVLTEEGNERPEDECCKTARKASRILRSHMCFEQRRIASTGRWAWKSLTKARRTSSRLLEHCMQMIEALTTTHRMPVKKIHRFLKENLKKDKNK